MSDGMGVPRNASTSGDQPQGVPPQADEPGAGSPSPFVPGGWQPDMLPAQYRSAEPDWEQLALKAEQSGQRKRLLTVVGIGLGVVLLGGGAITTALMMQKSHPTPDPTISPDGGNSARPSSSSNAPAIKAEDLFAQQTLTIMGHQYLRKVIQVDKPCWKGTGGGLGTILGDNDCSQLMRATYLSGNTAVTVGVAVFDSEKAAHRAADGFKGQIQPLSDKNGDPTFCQNVTCPASQPGNTGRYMYVALAGPLNGTDQTIAQGAAKEVADYFGGELAKNASGAPKG